jgi:5-methyltetrahydrofolate--homocysteine methyltransferase
VASEHDLENRLRAGRPIVLGSEPAASLRSRGVALEGDAPLGRLVRERPSVVSEHYAHELAAGVDVLTALTSDTTPRALAQIGMAFRAAALTGTAVDLAHETAVDTLRPTPIAGVLGARWIAPMNPDRIAEEYARHAARLAAAECEVLLARGWVPGAGRTPVVGTIPPPAPSGMARLTRMAAIVSGSSTGLPTWAVLELGPDLETVDGEVVEQAARSAVEAGASLLLVKVFRSDTALIALERLQGARVPVGVLLGMVNDAREEVAAELWATQAKRLFDAGARVVGGGLGVPVRAVAALTKSLGRVDRSSESSRVL